MVPENEIKISLLHPSYGRPQQAIHYFEKWEMNAEMPHRVEYLLGLDDNDPSLEKYMDLFATLETKFGNKKIIVSSTRNIVEVFNNFPLHVDPNSELFVGMADDMEPISGWDLKLYDLVKGSRLPAYIHVNDGQFPFNHPWSNYLIVNRAFYERLGYMLCPEYDGVCADVDISAVARKLGAVIEAPEYLFQHNHYCIGRAVKDDTYLRHNTPLKTERNKAIFEARKARGFDL